MGPSARLLAVVLTSVGVASCNSLLGIDSTTLAPSDPGNDWSCVGAVAVGTPTVTSIAITVNIVDFTTGLAPAGALNVKACATKTDSVCTPPLATATSDATGTAIITIPLTGGRGFNGYLAVTGTNYIPYLWYFSRPLIESRSFPLNVLTVDELDGPSGLLASFGVAPPDDTRGHLAVNTTDCQDIDAPGVQITTDDEDAATKPFYYSDGLLSSKVTETQKGFALGGFFNLPAATVTVTATPIALGKAMGQNTLIIAPHTLTTIRMLPN